MKARLEGIVETQGEFQGKAFHSVKLHCTAPIERTSAMVNSAGRQVLDVISIKYEDLPFVAPRPMRIEELATYVGADIDLDFTQNKRLCGFSVPIDEPTASKK